MLEKIIEITREAGNLAKEGFGKNMQIDFKTSAANLVTEYDTKCENLIIDFVKKEFPTHSILAEESGTQTKDSEYVWVIDPIDGTSNYAHHVPMFSVSIGVQKNGETIAGVIYDVMRDMMYSCELGSGSFANGRKLNVSAQDKLSHSLVATGFPYHAPENPNHMNERFLSILPKARGIRRLGSAAIDFCYVAEGAFDAYWEVALQAWDMCAGILLVEEAGGIVTHYNGEKAGIFGKEIAASNKYLHDEFLTALNDF